MSVDEINHINQDIINIKDNLYQDTWLILSDLLNDHDKMIKEIPKIIAEHHQTEPLNYFSDDNKITLYQDWYELLFAIGQVGKSVDMSDYDILMASWLQLNHQGVLEHHKEELQPIIYQTRKADWRGVIYDNFMWVLENPKNAISLFKGELDKFYLDTYKILPSFKQILIKFALLNQAKSPLTLLSLPTHRPSFIEPIALVERILAYQNAGVAIDLTDFAIAIARTPRINTEPAIALLDHITDELTRHALRLALGADEPSDSIPPVAALQLLQQSENYHHLIAENEHINQQITQLKLQDTHDNPNQKAIRMRITELSKNKNHHIKNSTYNGWIAVFKTIIDTHYPDGMLTPHEDIYIFTKNIKDNLQLLKDNYYIVNAELQQQWLHEIENQKGLIAFELPFYNRLSHSADIYMHICAIKNKQIHDKYSYFNDMSIVLFTRHLTPLNQRFNDKMTYNMWAIFQDQISKKDIDLLVKLNEKSYAINRYTQCILVNCLFAKHKEIRLAALDSIISAICQQKIDSEIMAEHIKWCIEYDYAPLSRLLDSITLWQEYDSMYQYMLCDILDNVFIHLHLDKIPTGFKKLLEQYYQLLSKLNRSPIKDDSNYSIHLQFHHYLSLSDGLKSIINKLNKLS